MASKSNDDQFKFLISCIRHANNSKVDFAEVAKECGIVSKGAAAKRYERMMKAHGINPGGPATRGSPSVAGSRRDTTSSAKKRKLDQFVGDSGNHATDDDEGVRKVKKEVGEGAGEQPTIKTENEDAQGSASIEGMGQGELSNGPPPAPAGEGATTHKEGSQPSKKASTHPSVAIDDGEDSTLVSHHEGGAEVPDDGIVVVD